MEELQSTILKLQRELQEAQEEIREKDKEIESLLQQNRALTQHIKALNEALSKSGDQANVTEVGTLSLATENKVLQTTLDSRTEILKDWLENAKVWESIFAKIVGESNVESDSRTDKDNVK